MVYTGRHMKTSHIGMRIDEQDWKVFMAHVSATLDHFTLTGEDREAVVSFVESTKGDIVEAQRITVELSERGTGGVELIGTVESLWRYPIKGMRGEALKEAFVGFPGVYGDRVYAFRNSVAPKGLPYLTSRELETLLLYQPRYRNPERMTKPANLAEAEAIAPGLTPVYADSMDVALDVDTPSGDRLAIGDER
jgi:MOSC N-terminal beta barrel domain